MPIKQNEINPHLLFVQITVLLLNFAEFIFFIIDSGLDVQRAKIDLNCVSILIAEESVMSGYK